MTTLIVGACALACPLMMVVMMISMRRGHGQHGKAEKPRGHDER